MDVKRRGFLGAILAAGFAPAFVGSSILMPVRKFIEIPKLIEPLLHGFSLDEMRAFDELIASMDDCRLLFDAQPVPTKNRVWY